MKVGVLGSGDVAKVLGTGFLNPGQDVMMGTRSATKLPNGRRRIRLAALAASTARQGLPILWCGPSKALLQRMHSRAAGETNLNGRARDRSNESDRGCAAQEWCLEFLYQSRRVAYGDSAARVFRCLVRQGFQLCRQRPHGEPSVRGCKFPSLSRKLRVHQRHRKIRSCGDFSDP
jgi:hypothetical protein